VGIAAVDLDDKGVAVIVGRVDQEYAGGLTLRDMQRVRGNTQAETASASGG
jgi:hypothetical protein